MTIFSSTILQNQLFLNDGLPPLLRVLSVSADARSRSVWLPCTYVIKVPKPDNEVEILEGSSKTIRYSGKGPIISGHDMR